MNEKYTQLLNKLGAVIVARVSKVVTKDKDLICFTAIGGGSIWDDDPRFEFERGRFSDVEWEKTERSYSHYFGFATYPGNLFGSSGQIYFQRDDYLEVDYFNSNNNIHSELNPPKVGDHLIGRYELVPGKGLRLKSWSYISEFEVYIRAGLINGLSMSEETVGKMETSSVKGRSQLVNFARLILNEQIGYYLNLKKTGAPKAEDEAYTYRSRIDSMVYGVVNELRPDLWEKYKEASLEEKMYSSTIREPAPTPIVDNLTGHGEKVGLNTPFSSLKLA
ncbi:MAG: hypothetical protein PHG25_03985 [Candidatus Pacebacteria bacterium]|nr:hypothetical protein [Candidatus Paceibacterota bacterium]